MKGNKQMSNNDSLLRSLDNIISNTKYISSITSYVSSNFVVPFGYCANNPKLLDITSFPHLLVAGTTGSGKSVFINSLICSLIIKNNPEDLKLILIDPKQVEFQVYENLPHLACSIINSGSEALSALLNLKQVMEERFCLLKENKVKNISDLNAKGIKLPYIICIIDEFSNLVRNDLQKQFESVLIALAEKSRACGIHLIICTQRPSVKAINGDIKANFPTKISFKVSSAIESRIILGYSGAEKINEKGQFILDSPFDSSIKLNGFYLDDQSISNIVSFWVNLDLKNDFIININNNSSLNNFSYPENKKNVNIKKNKDQEKYAFRNNVLKVKKLISEGYSTEDIRIMIESGFELPDLSDDQEISYNSCFSSSNGFDKIKESNLTEYEQFDEPISSNNDSLSDKVLLYMFSKSFDHLSRVSLQDIQHALNISSNRSYELASKLIKKGYAFRAFRGYHSYESDPTMIGIYYE